jgi:hypothetical protein
LFQIDPSLPVKVLYRDDENDLITITSQMELESAIADCSILRLFISHPVPAAIPLPQSFPNARLMAIEAALKNPNLPPHCVERLTRRKSMIEARLSQQPKARSWRRRSSNEPAVFGPQARLERIQKVLEQPDLPAAKREKLMMKQAMLEERIQKKSAASPVPDRPAPEQPVPRGPAFRLAKVQAFLNQPNLPPRRIERLTQQKTRLEQILKETANPNSPQTPFQGTLAFGPEARLARLQLLLDQPALAPEKRQRLLFKKGMIESKLEQKAAAASNFKFQHGPAGRLHGFKCV